MLQPAVAAAERQPRVEQQFAAERDRRPAAEGGAKLRERPNIRRRCVVDGTNGNRRGACGPESAKLCGRPNIRRRCVADECAHGGKTSERAYGVRMSAYGPTALLG